MNLYSGQSLWKSTWPHVRQYPTLEEDIQCDVLVIGAGDSGALISYKLTEQGIRTVLVDKRAIGHGSSLASTGLLQFTSDKSLTSCIHTFGVERGVRFYRLGQEAVEAICNISTQLVYSPDCIRRDCLYYASSPEDVPGLQEEYETLKRHGFPVQYWDGGTLAKHFSFTKSGAIYMQGDAEINPYKFVNALVQNSHERGLRVYAHTEIHGHRQEQGGLVFFAGKHRIRARHAIYATGYETQEIKRNSNVKMSSAFVMVTPPIPDFSGWHNRCLIWETARPYLYMRTTADNRIIVGGLDENTTRVEERERMLSRKKERLLEEVSKLFPDLPSLSVEYAWTAAFGSTHDGLPMIGTQESYPNCFFILGYGGNGTVYSMVAAQIISDWIVKGSSPDAELFRIDRPTRSFTVH